MKLKVENETVRRNVELFKILLKRVSQQTNSNTELETRTYHAFIHRTKGDIRFEEVSQEADVSEKKDWKPIVFRVYVDMQNKEKLSCSVMEGDEKIFQWDDLKKDAYHVLKETLKTIQLISRILPRIESLPRLFLEFSQINLASSQEKEKTGKDLIHEAWHQIDRAQAEILLKNMDNGTYLFRKDGYAAILEEQLSDTFKYPIKCVTLTYIDNTQRICDYTIVKTEEGWLIYNDDPSLREPTYPSSTHLFDSLAGILKTPLLH